MKRVFPPHKAPAPTLQSFIWAHFMDIQDSHSYTSTFSFFLFCVSEIEMKAGHVFLVYAVHCSSTDKKSANNRRGLVRGVPVSTATTI